jgi:hypothetical protein
LLTTAWLPSDNGAEWSDQAAGTGEMWAYPSWWSVMHSAGADAAREDVDWWAKCINNEELINVDVFSKFDYFTGALPEFRALMCRSPGEWTSSVLVWP